MARTYRNLHALFPTKRLIILVISLSLFVQIVVIVYNHFSGFHPLDGMLHFFLRLARGLIYSTVFGFLIALADLWLIFRLTHKFPWSKQVTARLLLQFGFTLAMAFVISALFTFTADTIKPYSERIETVYISNALIFGVVNILLMIVFEAWIFSDETTAARKQARLLEKELSQIRFEVLKSQINPHFLFNSLNVLSGLISKDTRKAQEFIDEFSMVYRYVLETIEKKVVSLEQELGFVHAYLFLQQIRYGQALQVTIKLPAEKLAMLMPPLSMQLVLENAIKHNIILSEKPLLINISCDDDYLVIRNNIQTKVSKNKSTGLGQSNLQKRYAMICSKQPEFTIESLHYTARLPLIKPENNEYSDH
ncbi:MAG: sensor histidine kinase [Bacteroidales bacterium]|nr:sensor histidine kinase [Bacteroidales bacterium]